MILTCHHLLRVQNIVLQKWAVQHEYIDKHIHLLRLSRFLAAPQEGHLAESFPCFKKHTHPPKVFNDVIPIMGQSPFHWANWIKFYLGAAKLSQLLYRDKWGGSINMYCFCYSDHAGWTIEDLWYHRQLVPKWQTARIGELGFKVN